MMVLIQKRIVRQDMSNPVRKMKLIIIDMLGVKTEVIVRNLLLEVDMEIIVLVKVKEESSDEGKERMITIERSSRLTNLCFP